MQQTNSNVKKDSVKSMDGTVIGYKVTGEGPGLVIVHGSFRASQHYMRLAGYLSDAYTVYILDRRGRNESGVKGSGYSVQKECEDVIAILHKHKASFVLGHSYGGLIALNVALQYPITKLAVYEPAIVSHIPMSWMPKFEQELKENDYISASITFLKGMRMGGTMGKMPKTFLKILFRAMAKGADWKENVQLLRTLPEELHAGLLFDSNIERYKHISIPTLVMSGTKSPGYLIAAARELESILPNKQSLPLVGLDHSAPDEKAPEKIAQILKGFFV